MGTFLDFKTMQNHVDATEVVCQIWYRLECGQQSYLNKFLTENGSVAGQK